MRITFVTLLLLALPAFAQEYADKSNLLFYRNAQNQLQPVRSADDWAQRVRHIQTSMQAVMGPLPETTREPFDVTVSQEVKFRHYTRQQILFTVEKGDRLSGYLLVPHGSPGEKFPAMICLPGSSAPGKDAPAGRTANAPMAYGHELAERGYVCLILDYPLLHTKTDPYAMGYVSATMKGIVNHRRGVDLLQSLPMVDGQRIGVIGHSLGGHNALFLAIFEPRIRAIVSSCGFNVFAKHNKGDVRAWSSRYYMPRIKTVYGDDPTKIPFDFTEVLAGLAPRPVFINAPLHDEPDFEVSGVRDCVTAALPVYQLHKAAPKLIAQYPNAGHTFPTAQRHACYAFLDQHLRAAPEPLGIDDFALQATIDGEGGDIVSRYDAARKRSLHLSLHTRQITTSQASTRQLHFGIDDGQRIAWQDCGHPGRALIAFSMAVHDGNLYAGTCNPAPGASGRVYRYLGGEEWIDCGAPDASNAVMALAVHEGQLYAGTGKYRTAGSARPDSENVTLGGRILRYDGGTKWVDCGRLPETEAIGGFAVFRGKLYASSLYKPAGFYRYDGGTKWTDAGTPGARVVALGVYRDALYATSYDDGRIYRYDGNTWSDLGRLGSNTQTYSFVTYQGKLHVGTWPSGRVYRLDEGDQWHDCGRLGEETEVMGMIVHNGHLLAGTLPLAQIYEYNGGTEWKLLKRLDWTPDSKYRRVWTMAEYQGRVFASTLPSGRIYALEIGHNVTADTPLSPGPHRIVAQKQGGRLTLFVDGQRVAQSPPIAEGILPGRDLRNWKAGPGMNEPFRGQVTNLDILPSP